MSKDNFLSVTVPAKDIDRRVFEYCSVLLAQLEAIEPAVLAYDRRLIAEYDEEVEAFKKRRTAMKPEKLMFLESFPLPPNTISRVLESLRHKAKNTLSWDGVAESVTFDAEDWINIEKMRQGVFGKESISALKRMIEK